MTNEDLKVVENTLELLETMEEGINYVIKNFKPEEAMGMLMDIVNAFASIEEAVGNLLPKLPENEIVSKNTKLKDSLEVVIGDYESNNGQKAIDLIQNNLAPMFNEWKEEIESHLRKYVAN
ncbi:hypothetical protein PRVXT_000511 [Proteinivorax tanatarense]|uniref:DUF8042 domain-containing protein n=1 Tax=Proteinivorax tanatarense TaxID=1260629 RepID=A0AAU7VN75_9FIRM